MKAKISSTDRVVAMKDCNGEPFTARVWEGVTDGGVEFTAYIAVVQVLRTADGAEFDCDLKEHDAPSAATVRAIDARFIL